MVAGASVAGGEWWLVVVYAGAFLAVYVPVMLAEVETMRALFPNAYDAWAAEVPLFFPRLGRRDRAPRGPGFDRRLYVRYREYRAVLGLAAVFAVLVAKLVFRG